MLTSSIRELRLRRRDNSPSRLQKFYLRLSVFRGRSNHHFQEHIGRQHCKGWKTLETTKILGLCPAHLQTNNLPSLIIAVSFIETVALVIDAHHCSVASFLPPILLLFPKPRVTPPRTLSSCV